MHIAERIKLLCEKNKITGVELGRRLGLSKSPLTDWKNGKSKPTADQISIMCEIFATSADYLIGRTDDPRPPGDLLVVPEELKGVYIAATNGEEDWTQDELDRAAEFLRFVRAEKRKANRDG